MQPPVYLFIKNFWLRRSPITFTLIKLTNIKLKKNSHRRCSIKKLFSKISQYSQEAPLLESHFYKCNFFKKRVQQRCFPVANFLRNTCFEGHLCTAASELNFWKVVGNFTSGRSLSKPSWLLITKIP